MADLATITCFHEPECQATLTKRAKDLAVTLRCADKSLTMELATAERQAFSRALVQPLAEGEMGDIIAEHEDDGTIFFIYCEEGDPGPGGLRRLTMEDSDTFLTVTLSKEDEALLKRFLAFAVLLSANDDEAGGAMAKDTPFFGLPAEDAPLAPAGPAAVPEQGAVESAEAEIAALRAALHAKEEECGALSLKCRQTMETLRNNHTRAMQNLKDRKAALMACREELAETKKLMTLEVVSDDDLLARSTAAEKRVAQLESALEKYAERSN